MKKMSLLMLVVLLAVPSMAATIVWWDFEDGAPGAPFAPTGQTNVLGSRDKSGNGNDLYGYSDYYGPAFSQKGQTATGIGLSCAHIGHNDGYTSGTPMVNTWAPTAWTIEASFKLDNISGWKTIIGKDGFAGGGTQGQFYLQRRGDTGNLRVEYYTADNQHPRVESTITIAAGKWYHIAATSDGTSLKLYIDQLDGNGFQLQNTTALTGNTAMKGTSSIWTVGRGYYNGGFVDHIYGFTDDIRLSNVALSPDQFLQNQRAKDPSPAQNSKILSSVTKLSWTNPSNINKCEVRFARNLTSEPNALNYKTLLPIVETINNPPQKPEMNMPAALDDGDVCYWVVDCYKGSPLPAEPNFPGLIYWKFTVNNTPAFIANPAMQVKAAGETAVFTAEFSSTTAIVTGWPKWFKKGIPDKEMDNPDDPDVTIATTNVGNLYTTTLTIANAGASDVGEYYCQAQNGAGISVSTSAKLALKKLLAHWKFDGDPNDASGNGMNGTLVGTAVFSSTDSKIGQALQFNGTDCSVTVPSGFADFTTGLGFTVWAKPTAANNWARFIDFGNGAAADNIFVSRAGTSSTLRFDSSAGGVEVTNALTQNEWQMLVVTMDPAGQVIIYKNGLSIGTGGVGLPANVTRTSNFIGKSNWPDALYAGLMDDVRLYNYALTADEVAVLYADVAGDFCRTKPVHDVNGDCKVNLADLTVLVQHWMECGLYPACP